MEFEIMERIVQKIEECLPKRLQALTDRDAPFLVALDGRCAAGKTTLAARLQEETGCTVFHMDDFFLRPGQRVRERLDTPGGNVDHERFREEILVPLREGEEEISYRPYDCHTQELLPPVSAKPSRIVLVEGSYSCHPELWDFYGLHIFLTVDPKEQLRRIAARGGADSVRRFRERWIPLEESYFKAFQVRERCELCLEIPTNASH